MHRQPPASKNDDYLGDMDLPSSECDSEEEMVSNRAEDKKDTHRIAQVDSQPNSPFYTS